MANAVTKVVPRTAKDIAAQVTNLPTWQAIQTAPDAASLLKALYEHFRAESKGRDAKGVANDKKYGTDKIAVSFRRAVPTPEGIVQMSLMEAFADALIGFGMLEIPAGTRPAMQAALIDDAYAQTLEQLASEGYRVEKPRGGPALFCGPDVPTYSGQTGEVRRAGVFGR